MGDQQNEIMVSICCTAYNHEKYIEKALEGFIMQQCNFKFEILVSDDASTDNTASIIKKYESKYPHLFKVFYLKENQYSKGNKPLFNILFPAAKGKYIALCEGDDYWIDPLKLQKQVDFLEANEGYVLCFTNRNKLKENQLELVKTLHHKNSFSKAESPLIHVPTLTVIFKNVVNEIPSSLYSCMIDCTLFLFLSQYGNFYYMNEVTAVYRIHNDGVWSGASELENYKRNINVRICAWRNLKKIDKFALANVLIYWIIKKKELELKRSTYLSMINSSILEYYFRGYILKIVLFRKIKFALKIN